jgi:hypothetical protein
MCNCIETEEKLKNMELAIESAEDLLWGDFRSIAYVKELRRLPLVKSVNAGILMARLEAEFFAGSDCVSRYLTPCPSQEELGGKSWTETLGMSSEEFKAAFDEIGIRYKSYSEASEVDDDLCKGKYYFSIIDHSDNGVTHYYRNDELVDSCLERFVYALES